MSRVTRLRTMCALSWMGVSAAALAGEPAPTPPQEPVGLITGAVIGGFAAGPVGAVVGAGLGTWLGNRVHRAGEAKKADAEVASLRREKSQLEAEKAGMLRETSDLADTNRTLTARLDELSQRVDAARAAEDAADGERAARALDGLQGDVLFRTGSAQIAPEMTQSLKSLAQTIAKSPALKVRVDGFADPRGTVDANLELSRSRADAVRDLLLSAGVPEESLEVNAYGKSQSTAADADGFALERRVRLTLASADEAPDTFQGPAQANASQ